MNLVYGEVADLGIEQGMRMGRVRISGAMKKVPLDLLKDVQCGDTVLICDGVAIGKVNHSQPSMNPSRVTDHASPITDQ